MGRITKGLRHILNLPRLRKGNRLSGLASENSSWKPHGVWIGRAARGSRQPGRRRRRWGSRQETLGLGEVGRAEVDGEAGVGQRKGDKDDVLVVVC